MYISFNDGKTKMQCFLRCMDLAECVAISYSVVKNRCKIHATVFRASPKTSRINVEYVAYEMKNPCTGNPNLCEHGSFCSPIRPTKSYECVNCLPPYFGKHCNETLGAPLPAVTEDIIYGRNSSCRMLDHFFGLPSSSHLPYFIHPWRDARKIKVLCKKDEMMISDLKSWSTSPIRFLKSEDLKDGLDISQPNYLAHTSFIKTLNSLMHFDKFYIGCTRDDSAWFDFSNKLARNSGLALVNYWTNDTNSRPKSSDMNRNSGGTPGYDFTLLDEKYSSPDVDIENRPFQDFFVGANGDKMTFTENEKECFGYTSSWLSFRIAGL
ncbi:uncharacterized protein [Clytia hemisphaerica]